MLAQLATALRLIGDVVPAQITTLGGGCSVSVAPFSELAQRYGQDLAVVWIDSHPDVESGQTAYAGYHAIAVLAPVGHRGADVLVLLPATVRAARVALVGPRAWEPDVYAHVGERGGGLAGGPEHVSVGPSR